LLKQKKVVLWEVDTQVDFMLPGGKLHVPGAEKLIPNINRLVDFARDGSALLVSSGCHHSEDDPEFELFPPHCLRGTEGAKLIPESLAQTLVRVPNDPGFVLPADLFAYQQILFEKQTQDVFESAHAAAVVDGLPEQAEFLVFGVVTEYCVGRACHGLLQRGRRVSIVTDAIETLDSAAGRNTIAVLASRGAQVLATQEALIHLRNS
jgi:nicotinamidase/pyrazinamidase